MTLTVTEKGNRYTIVAMNYFTRWSEARALREANALTVNTFIYEGIICHHECPDFSQTDRGTHFVNKLITQLLARFEIRYNKRLNKDFEKEPFVFEIDHWLLEPAYKKLRQMKEEEFVQLLEDKDSSTRGILSGTSCDFMDQQTLTASEEVSDLQNSNTFDLFWKDLLADPNQPQLTPINLDQPQLTLINLDQPQPTPINPN